jgi:hypothetical protein
MMHPRSIDVTSLASHHIIALLPLVCALLLITIFSQNAPTQSLLRVVNGILDESIERKRGEIPHVSLFSTIFNEYIVWNYCLFIICS